jgi:hypothetical protein
MLSLTHHIHLLILKNKKPRSKTQLQNKDNESKQYGFNFVLCDKETDQKNLPQFKV